MAHSKMMQRLRDEQGEEMQRMTPAERLLLALEVSDVCSALNAAGRKVLEERNATGKITAGS